MPEVDKDTKRKEMSIQKPKIYLQKIIRVSHEQK